MALAMAKGKVVAPFAGAWIEIYWPKYRKPARVSLPSRERGLKFDEFQSETGDYWSLPSRERGLK